MEIWGGIPYRDEAQVGGDRKGNSKSESYVKSGEAAEQVHNLPCGEHGDNGGKLGDHDPPADIGSPYAVGNERPVPGIEERIGQMGKSRREHDNDRDDTDHCPF